MEKSEEKVPAKAVITPTRARAVSWNDSKSRDEQQSKKAGQLQEKQVKYQDNLLNQDQKHIGSQSADPPAPDKPARRTRSARAIHSLRKSLAWDKAFSTEEGILDGDELHLVAKTPKKLPDLPPLDLPDILALVSPTTKSAPSTSVEPPKSVPIGELPTTVKPIPDNSEHHPNTPSLSTIIPTEPTGGLSQTEALPLSGNGNTTILHGARNSTSQCSPSVITSPIHLKTLSGIPRQVPVIHVIDDAVKGTKLRLPNSSAHIHNKPDKGSEEPVKYEVKAKVQQELEIVAKQRKDTEKTHMKPLKDMHTLTRCRSTSSLMKPPSTSTSISKKVSSVSKKVKDTIGRVLPGSMGGRSSASRKAIAETAHADRLRPATNIAQSSGTALKVPGSPGPSYLARSKSARSVNGVTAEANVQKTGVLAELSNKASSSNASVKLPQGQKKSKGESIWGSIRGRGGSSATKGNENVPLNTSIPSPQGLKKTGGAEEESENSHLNDFGDSNSDASQDLSSQISKPSGLRLPSPKIGFFDPGRPAGSHEKQTVAVTDVLAKHGLPPRPPSQHASASVRFAQPSTVDPLVAAVRGYLSSGIPVAPHVTRASGISGRKGLVPSASAPASPRKNSEMLSPGTHQAVTGRYLTSRSNFTRVNFEASPEPRKEASGAARKLALEHSDGKLQRVASEIEETVAKESSFVSTGCGEELQNTKDSARTECSTHLAEATVVNPTSVTTMTDIAEVPLNEPVEEKRTESKGEVSSVTVSSLEKSQTPTRRVNSEFSGDLTDHVLADHSRVESNNGSIDHLVESLHDSPSIQSTFWNLQAPNPPPSEKKGCNGTEIPSNPNGSSSGVKDASQDVGEGGRAERVPQVLDQVSIFPIADEHHEKINVVHATSSSIDHGRRMSVIGWQEMHASLSSPVLNSAHSDDQAIQSQESESSLSLPGSEGKVKTGASSNLCITIPSPLSEKSFDDDFHVEHVADVRKQEAGQIMNGACIDDLRADSFKQENSRNTKVHSVLSAERKGETSPVSSTKTLEKENLQSKLENLFEAHWSGWPVLEAATPVSSSRPRETSGTPDSQRGSDGAENSYDRNCASFRHAASPWSDADAYIDSRNPLVANRALLNTATDGLRLSVTPPLKKERGLLAFARSAVSRLTSAASGGSSPRNENSRAIDREGPGSGSFRKSRRNKSNTPSKTVDISEGNESAESVSLFSGERIKVLEAAVEEAILMKRGGAVQHSPPNKTQPPPNPWSPVKKGQHPGPFDCTKKTAVNTLVL